MKFNEKLVILRTNEKLSQQQIADYLGIGQTTYSRYERLNTLPDIFLIKKLAKFYKLSLDQLMAEIDEEEIFVKITREEAALLKDIAERVSKSESITINTGDVSIGNDTNVIIGKGTIKK